MEIKKTNNFDVFLRKYEKMSKNVENDEKGSDVDTRG
jgi:hypothetical protein